MGPQTRRRILAVLFVAASTVAASLVTASPAAAAKSRPRVIVNCFATTFPPTVPGYPIQCQAFVLQDIGQPTPTGSLTLRASSYKGTLSTTTCSSVTSCTFTYTPKGKGSDYRKDTVSGSYSGDANFYGARGSTKFSVAAAPQPVLELTCPESVQTGAHANCLLSFQIHGFQFPPTPIDLKAATYKGVVLPDRCSTIFDDFCFVTYTPKGRGYDSRVDKITASHPGDLYNSPVKVTETIKVTAAP